MLTKRTSRLRDERRDGIDGTTMSEQTERLDGPESEFNSRYKTITGRYETTMVPEYHAKSILSTWTDLRKFCKKITVEIWLP